jgi:hypothetical protein
MAALQVEEQRTHVGDLVANLAQWVVDALYSFGYVGVGVLAALGYLNLLPSTQLVLPLAGFRSGRALLLRPGAGRRGRGISWFVWRGGEHADNLGAQ